MVQSVECLGSLHCLGKEKKRARLGTEATEHFGCATRYTSGFSGLKLAPVPLCRKARAWHESGAESHINMAMHGFYFVRVHAISHQTDVLSNRQRGFLLPPFLLGVS